MADVAFFGIGLLGSGLVEGMLSRGESVVVWNRTISKAQALEPLGAIVIADAAEAAAAGDRIHICLTNDAAVDSLLSRISDHIRPGTLIIDHSTVSPEGVTNRAKLLDGLGLEFLHAPVFMSPTTARTAGGLMLTSGPRERFEKAKPPLSTMTADLWYVGEPYDKAAIFKLFGNAMLIYVVQALADIFTLAKGVGIEPADANQIFAHFSTSGAITMRGRKMAAGDFTPHFELETARKDAGLLLEMAQRNGVELAGLPGIVQRMDALIAAGHGMEDLAVLGIDATQSTH
ncbi:MAG TPA: NAD(P)-dependent oxidoreductase [Candidatus Baltobacteraceae bacterium]